MAADSALPLLLADTSIRTSNEAVSTQTSYHQIGGSNNTQYNAHTINQHYAAQARVESPPLPTSTVPFPRDPIFVDRPELKELEERLSPRRRGARVALVGLGGIGKTQLAIEYCYRLREAFPDTWVLWVHARSSARLEESLRKLAYDVKIPKRDEPQADIFQLVRDWLVDAKRKWLIVVDNADNPEVLFQPYSARNGNATAMKVRIDCVPVCEHGTTIITTRNQAVASRLVDAYDTIDIRRMSEADAVRLIVTKIASMPGGRRDTTGVEKLVTALDCLPLVLAQAAAYIGRAWPRCSVQEYLTQLETSKSAELLNTDYRDLRRENEAENAIFKTWKISFEEVDHSHPSAAKLLSLMCFYDYQGIPTMLLRDACYNNTEAVPEQSGDSLEPLTGTTFDEDVRVLLDYHFISIAPEEDRFVMHRLVQKSARDWIESHGQTGQWTERSIISLDKVLPRVDFGDREQCAMLHPHAKLFVDSKPAGRSAILAWASVICKTGVYLLDRGLATEAEPLVEMSRAARRDILGDDNPLTLESRFELGLVFRVQRKYEAAERMHRQVLERREEVLGKEHPDTLRSLVALANVLEWQEKYKEAEEIARQDFERREKVLGKEHPDTLSSLTQVANSLCDQRKYNEAEKIQRQVLESTNKLLDEGNDGLWSTLTGLAMILVRQGKCEEAERIYRPVYESTELALGKEHPTTLDSLWAFAVIVNKIPNYEEASRLMGSCAEISGRILGSEHPKTISRRRSAEEYAGQAAEIAGKLNSKIKSVRQRFWRMKAR